MVSVRLVNEHTILVCCITRMSETDELNRVDKIMDLVIFTNKLTKICFPECLNQKWYNSNSLDILPYLSEKRLIKEYLIYHYLSQNNPKITYYLISPSTQEFCVFILAYNFLFVNKLFLEQVKCQ